MKCGLSSGNSSRYISEALSVGHAELIGKRRIVNWLGNVLMNKLLRVVQFTGTGTVFKTLPKSDPDPFSFAFYRAWVGLQCVYLFLQGKVLVR